MIHYNWVSSPKILKRDNVLEVKQIYCWITTADKKVIIVSKSGKDWQFPGGKPKLREGAEATIKREVLEETGYKLSKEDINNLRLFGYNVVKVQSGSNINTFLQLRYFIRIDESSKDLILHPNYEDVDQDESDKIKFVQLVSLSSVAKLMLWLINSEEYGFINKCLAG